MNSNQQAWRAWARRGRLWPAGLVLGALWSTAETGYAQRCLSFNGAQSARVLTERAAPVPLGNFTVGAWVRPAAGVVASRQTLVGSPGGPGALPWALVLRPDRTTAFAWRSPAGQWLEVPGPGSGSGLNNQWYYCGVIVTTDASGNGTVRMVLDTAPTLPGIGEANLTALPTSSGQPIPPPAFALEGPGNCSLVIGSGFKGELDDVFVADGAIALNRIYDFAFKPLPAGEVPIIGFWRFDASGVDSSPSSSPRATTLEFLHGCGSEGPPLVRFSDAPVPGWSPDMNREFAALPVSTRPQTSLSGVATAAFRPVLASDGNLTALMTTTGSAVQVRTSDGRALTWSAPKTISGTQIKNVDFGKSGDTALLVMGQQILAVWKDGRFDNPGTPAIEQELFFSASINGGLQWGAESRVNLGFPIGTRVIGEFSLDATELPGGGIGVGLGVFSGPSTYPSLPNDPQVLPGKFVSIPVAPYFQYVPCPPPPIPTLNPLLPQGRIDNLALNLSGPAMHLAVTVDPFQPFGGVDQPDADVWVISSLDGGQSWLGWQRLDISGPSLGHASGMLELASLDGALAVGWTEALDVQQGKRSLYLATSNNFGVNFSPAQIIGNYQPGVHDVNDGDLAFAGLGAPGAFPNLLLAWSDNRWGEPLPFGLTIIDGGNLILPEFGFSDWLPPEICPPWPIPLTWPPTELPCPFPPQFCDDWPFLPPPPPECPPWCEYFGDPFGDYVGGIHILTHWRDKLGPIINWNEVLPNGLMQLRGTFALQNGNLWQRPFKILQAPTQAALEFGICWNPIYKNVLAAGKIPGLSQLFLGGFRGTSMVLEAETQFPGPRFRSLVDGSSAPATLQTGVHPWSLGEAAPGPLNLWYTLLSLTPGPLPVQTTTGLLDVGVGLDSLAQFTLASSQFQSQFTGTLSATPWVQYPLASLQGLGIRAVGLVLEDLLTNFQVTGISDALNL